MNFAEISHFPLPSRHIIWTTNILYRKKFVLMMVKYSSYWFLKYHFTYRNLRFSGVKRRKCGVNFAEYILYIKCQFVLINREKRYSFFRACQEDIYYSHYTHKFPPFSLHWEIMVIKERNLSFLWLWNGETDQSDSKQKSQHSVNFNFC